jgi:subtilisin family serine protease
MNHMLSSAALIVSLHAVSVPVSAGEIDHGLQTVLQNTKRNEVVSTIIFLWDQGGIDNLTAALQADRAPRSVRNEEVLRTLRDTAAPAQRNLMQHLARLHARGRIASYEPFWLVNAVRVDATPSVIEQLVEHPDVKRVYFNLPIHSIAAVADENQNRNHDGDNDPEADASMSASVPPGIAAIRAPEVWNLGVTGSGVLVATLDTGVSGSHPALGSRWRGHHPEYQGSPQWAWFDPRTNTTSPQEFSSSSHGTHTMGTILGGSPGEAIGVAPGAEWIHAAVIDRVNIQTTVADAIAAFQWIVDPDGNPGTHWDVPHVCSNSWGLTTNHGYPECDDLFWSFIDNAEAAGVVMLFAAGNEGSNGLRRPADRATNDFKNVAVGAVNPHDSSYPVASFSSRGPTSCTPDGGTAIKPDISAPGVNVYSAVAGDGYSGKSGTSMAAPHVAGVVALMYEACPHLHVDDVKQILYGTALDLGTPGKNNQYGWGMVDALEAVLAAQDACDFTIRLPNGTPSSVAPGIPTTLTVQIIETNEQIEPGSAMLHYRVSEGPFIDIPLTHISGEKYHATLPAMSCDDTPQFYFSATGANGTVRTNPSHAPEQVHAAAVGVVMDFPTLDHSFADGLPTGWTMNGLWNITSECPVEGKCPSEQWAYYGNASTCRYDTGFNPNSGSMISAPIALPHVDEDEQILLSFCYTLTTEPDFAYDRARLYINGQLIKQFHDAAEWTTFTYDLTNRAGQTITLEWNFNTVDGMANFYRGWQVDRVRIISPQFICEDVEPTCTGDLNGDGVVDGADLLLLLGAWGSCPTEPVPCPADISGDGVVDGVDLLALLAAWGQCP